MSPGGSVNSSVGDIGWCDPSQRVLTPKMGIHVFWSVYSFFGVHHFLVCTHFWCVNSFFGVHHFLVCTHFWYDTIFGDTKNMCVFLGPKNRSKNTPFFRPPKRVIFGPKTQKTPKKGVWAVLALFTGFNELAKSNFSILPP